MPRQHCGVCLHPDLDWIDRAIAEGTPSLREIAKRTRLKLSAVWRHQQHGAPVKPKVLKNIAAEIKKLRAAQTAAKKRKDTSGALAYSREIRNWIALQAKTQVVTAERDGHPEELPRAEALSIAMGLIEAELRSPDVIAWIEQVHERVGHIVVPSASTSGQSEE